MRERGLVGREDLGEGDGDQGKGAGGRRRVGFCRVDDVLLLLMTIVVATLGFGFAAERLEEFIDDSHDPFIKKGRAGLKRRIGKEGEEEMGRGELGILYFGIFYLVGVFIILVSS